MSSRKLWANREKDSIFDSDMVERRLRRVDEIKRCKRCADMDMDAREWSQSSPSAHFDKQLIICLQDFTSLAAALLSHDTFLQLKQALQICCDLASEEGRKPPMDRVIHSGVIPLFVEYLNMDNFPELQCEAAWILANIASETSKGAKEVTDKGALPIFVNLLSSPVAEVRDQAVFALGVVAGHSPTFRDHILGLGALKVLLKQLNKHPKPSILRNATWTLSNFCGGIPPPSFKQVEPALETLKRLLFIDDCEVLSDSCLALCYLSGGTSVIIQEVINAGVCHRLVELLRHKSSEVVICALLAIGNLVAGKPSQDQVILTLGLLGELLKLLTDSFVGNSIKNEACFVISNITGASRDEIQAVIDAKLIESLVQLLKPGESAISYAAQAIFAAAEFGSSKQIEYLASKGCIEALCNHVDSSDLSLVNSCLDGLCVFIEKERESSIRHRYYTLIRNTLGFEKVHKLVRHENKRIARKAADLEFLLF